METNFNCYLCDQNNFDKIMTYRAPLSDTIFQNSKIIKCRNCGLLQINKKFSDGQIEDYYKNKYDRVIRYNFNQIQFPSDNKWSVFRGRALAKLMTKLNLCNSPDYTVMDLGCAYGHLLYGFKNYSENRYKIIGVDYEEIAKQIFENNHWTFKAGGIEDVYSEYTGKINILITSHVFEHVINPDDFLIKCGKLLAKDGILLWEIPNLNEFNLSCESQHSPHICLWDIHSIKKVLSENNFEIIFLETAGKKYTWFDIKKPLPLFLRRVYKKISSDKKEKLDFNDPNSIGFQLDNYGTNLRNIRLVAKKKDS